MDYTLFLAFAAGMYVAWNYIDQPSWIPTFGAKKTTGYTTKKTIDWAQVGAVLAGIVALFQSGVLNNIPALKPLGVFFQALLTIVTQLGTNAANAGVMVGSMFASSKNKDTK